MTSGVTSDEYSVRVATSDDWDHVVSVIAEAFGEAWENDVIDNERSTWEPERTLLTVSRDDVVACAGVFTRDLSVPGGVLPAAHVTLVSVRPTHRRRGLLTAMMRRQLADIRAQGEPVAVLWATEGRIYQRFGYGLATQKLALEVREARLREQPTAAEGRLRSLSPSAATELLSKVYEQVRADRVGWSSRDARWWGYVLSDPKSERDGATPLRVLVHEGQSEVDGYALWRVKRNWDGTGPKGQVKVREVVAVTPEAYRSLWRFLLSVDLTRSTEYWCAAVDEPLLHLVDEPRQLAGRLGDALWLRVVDVPAALAGRRYAAPVDVVIEVTDALVPENAGRWRLAGGPDSATCTRTDRPADLACDIGALGAAYLGGAALTTLAAAGRVAVPNPAALVPASLAFGWHRIPSAVETF
ncbi:MAG: GNAT family N-acetyltransferase [Micromonosporaceae bacterium]|nr:GNAT family N-acetyltransferase [Micromonosporaceae bacterium]